MTDERQDDEMLGRALSRAIETIDVNQTRFERSRIATAPARRSLFSLWQVATAAAAIVLALAIGSWLTRPTESGPVAGSPIPTVPPATQTAATQTPAATAATVSTRVFFVRDQLPPVSAYVASGGAHIAVDSIVERIAAAHAAPASSVPAGAVNPLALVGLRPDVTSVSAKISGDTANVEFDLSGGWGVRGAAQVQALVQQLVYTITEEPGIRRALITEKGMPHAVIDQLVIDKPLTREDVFGYADPAKPDKIEDAGTVRTAEIADWRASVDEVAPGLGRFVVEFTPQAVTTPSFVAQLERPTQEKRTEDGKWVITLTMPDTLWNQPAGEAFHCCPLKAVGKTPIIETTAYPLAADPPTNGLYRGVGFTIVLDDARPWRVFTLSNPARIVVDIGGAPQAVSDSVAIYSPKSGETTGRTLTVSGAARAFEAHVVWRVKDSTGRAVANGFALASLGSSAVWGTLQMPVTIPANVSGSVTLEVFWPSPKDGAEMGLVQVPLTVR